MWQLLYKKRAIICPQVTHTILIYAHYSITTAGVLPHTTYTKHLFGHYTLPYCLSLNSTISVIPTCIDYVRHTTWDYATSYTAEQNKNSFIIHFFMCRQSDPSSINMGDMPRKLIAIRRGENLTTTTCYHQ